MITRILFAVDRSAYCRLAAGEVAEMAGQLGAEVLLLHVVEVPRGVDASSYQVPEEGNRLIESMQELFQRPGLTVIPVGVQAARVGHVAEEIVEEATFYGVQLIVMGSKGESDLRGLLLGSTTHRVLQLAPCPVVVVPPRRDGGGRGKKPTGSR
ncbi:MAG: universal stress protein [Candidatus Dormibacteraeota bacterium]|nr:universal stress protein [Candidatus Dormibacteraeota bacterium]